MNARLLITVSSAELIILIIIIIMRKITGKHLLCVFLLAFPLSWAEDTKKNVRETENDTGEDSTFF